MQPVASGFSPVALKMEFKTMWSDLVAFCDRLQNRTRPDFETLNGVGSQMDMSIGHRDVLSVETDPNKPAKAPENISITRKKDKPPNLPMEAARRCSNELNACGDQTDTPIAHMDTHTIGDKTKMAEIKTGNVKMGRIDLKL